MAGILSASVRTTALSIPFSFIRPQTFLDDGGCESFSAMSRSGSKRIKFSDLGDMVDLADRIGTNHAVRIDGDEVEILVEFPVLDHPFDVANAPRIRFGNSRIGISLCRRPLLSFSST